MTWNNGIIDLWNHKFQICISQGLTRGSKWEWEKILTKQTNKISLSLKEIRYWPVLSCFKVQFHVYKTMFPKPRPRSQRSTDCHCAYVPSLICPIPHYISMDESFLIQQWWAEPPHLMDPSWSYVNDAKGVDKSPISSDADPVSPIAHNERQFQQSLQYICRKTHTKVTNSLRDEGSGASLIQLQIL